MSRSRESKKNDL